MKQLKKEIQAISLLIKMKKYLLKHIKVEEERSGYKLGVEEGDIVARWDSENQRAEILISSVKGVQGSVRVKIDVNEKGKL